VPEDVEAASGAESSAIAREAVDEAHGNLTDLVERLAAFSDPTRLQLLIAVHAAPGSPVKDLAAATGLAPNTVTQALVSLRRSGLVDRTRDGRLSRWTLTDAAAHQLLHHLGAPHSRLHPPH
jgi:ArsR family transcriptional regulator, lead/cadmium/zinc/bismuth-responsive transcriptional repressor